MSDEQCKERIVYGDWGRTKQCKRAAIEDGFCYQHSVSGQRARREQKEQRWLSKQAAERARASLPTKLYAERSNLENAMMRAIYFLEGQEYLDALGVLRAALRGEDWRKVGNGSFSVRKP